MAHIHKKIIIQYTSDTVDEPVIYNLVHSYNLMPNIVKASVNPEKEGYIVIDLSGQEEDYLKGLDYVRGRGMTVKPFAEKVVWDEGCCTQCGACTGVCPSGALAMRRPEMLVEFHSDQCVVCNMCIAACPVKAVRLDF